VAAHLVRGAAVVELERAVLPRTGPSLLATIRSTTERIGDASSLVEAANIAVNEVRRIAGYDRVMVYQFLADGSGSVVAETKAEDMSPFLEHRFPASDIPTQARELYRLSPTNLKSRFALRDDRIAEYERKAGASPDEAAKK
jgi:two-component system, chemotaxis family, sensor kinase Cph1